MRFRSGCWVAALVAVVAAGIAACAPFSSGSEGEAARAPTATSQSTGPLPPPPADGPPNIVFVLTDDLSTDLLRYMPHVQRMMRRGLSFSRYFVTDSLCCPSRASIFTGQFPHSTGVYSNLPPDGGMQVFNARGDQHHTFAVTLRGRGYRTAFMGKYMNGYAARQTLAPDTPPALMPPGWTDWAATDEGYEQFDYLLNVDGRQLIPYGHEPRDYMTTVLGDHGTGFISSAVDAGRPFLLEVATFAPHIARLGAVDGHVIPAPRDRRRFPFARAPRGPAFNHANTKPPVWLSRRRRLNRRQRDRLDVEFRERARSVLSVDRMIGRLERTLRAEGVADDTYLVFSSDNGYHLGQHRLRGGKETAFDHDVRVPLVVVGPGVPRGARTEAIAQNIDLAPTFERLAGARVPARVDGHSLVPLLRGRPPEQWRRTALIEHHQPGKNAADPDYEPYPSISPTGYEAIRGADFLYVEYGDGEREYYDIARDPHALHNIVGRLSPARLSRLHRRVSRLERCHGRRACWRAGAAAP
jgi:N-acetylglucosamine-6-sulfatase